MVPPPYPPMESSSLQTANAREVVASIGLLREALPNSDLLDSIARSLLAGAGNAMRFVEGFEEGQLDGFFDHAKQWLSDLDIKIYELTGEIPGLLVAFLHEVNRDVTPGTEGKITRDMAYAVEAANSLNPLKTLAALTASNDAQTILSNVEHVASELAHAMYLAGKEWLEELAALYPDLRKVGHKIGELIGALALEAIRFLVEAELPF